VCWSPGLVMMGRSEPHSPGAAALPAGHHSALLPATRAVTVDVTRPLQRPDAEDFSSFHLSPYPLPGTRSVNVTDGPKPIRA
jgi:hypothetical protein